MCCKVPSNALLWNCGGDDGWSKIFSSLNLDKHSLTKPQLAHPLLFLELTSLSPLILEDAIHIIGRYPLQICFLSCILSFMQKVGWLFEVQNQFPWRTGGVSSVLLWILMLKHKSTATCTQSMYSQSVNPTWEASNPLMSSAHSLPSEENHQRESNVIEPRCLIPSTLLHLI